MCYFYSSTYLFIPAKPTPNITSVVNIKPRYNTALPVFIANTTGASSISSSFGALLFGVESTSGESLSFLSFDISAVFIFSPMLSLLFIHVSTNGISAYSPGFNSVSFK